MTRLLMLVEGHSEEIFVNQTLAPFLASQQIFVTPILLWTKRLPGGGGFRGGVASWGQIRRTLLPLLQDSDAWVTTLIDFYGLPDDFPKPKDALVDVASVQRAFHEAVDSPRRFIPFLALHEFEAWVFSAPEQIAEHFQKPTLASLAKKIVAEAGGPEFINHGKSTHPKARLEALEPQYNEKYDSPQLMNKIGIATIRQHCPHFSDWLDRLCATARSG